MADQPKQPTVIDPDNVPETLCDGQFNVTMTGPLRNLDFYAHKARCDNHVPGWIDRSQIRSASPHCNTHE
jgi:hypothetical protein